MFGTDINNKGKKEKTKKSKPVLVSFHLLTNGKNIINVLSLKKAIFVRHR